jgi:hypothetical protein
MSSFTQLIKDLVDNLKPDLSPSGLDFNLTNVEIKLYDTIEDVCLENANHNWYNFHDVARLNNNRKRPKGIVSHSCTNNKRLVSMIIDIYQNTCFCIAGKIELR